MLFLGNDWRVGRIEDWAFRQGWSGGRGIERRSPALEFRVQNRKGRPSQAFFNGGVFDAIDWIPLRFRREIKAVFEVVQTSII